MGIKQRYPLVAREVADVCQKAGRDPCEVRVVAVSKTVSTSGVAEALAGGAQDFGENRPEALVEKAREFPQATWHFIGNIQSRRISDIVGVATLIHSLYQVSHVTKIDAAAKRIGKVQDVLIEVNVSGEKSKSGIAPKEAASLIQVCEQCDNIRLRGLMTMAPQGEPAAARACFDELARLNAQLRASLDPHQAAVFNELSMGMSEDWQEAVLAGATIVRIGRAIFDDTFGEIEEQEIGAKHA